MKIRVFYIIFFITLFFVIIIGTASYTITMQTGIVSGKDLNKEDVISMITQRVENERNYLRYREQEDEYNDILDTFMKQKDMLEIIVSGFGTERYMEIEFITPTHYMGKDFDEKLNTTRHLAMKGNRACFFYSDLLSYFRVCSDRQLFRALRNVKKDFEFATVGNGGAIFTLQGEYFEDKSTVVFRYLDNKKADFLVRGIPLDENWAVEIYGYEQLLTWYSYRNSVLSMSSLLPGTDRSWWWRAQNIKVDMQKKRMITVLLAVSILCMGGSVCISRLVVPEKSIEETKKIYIRDVDIEFNYTYYQPYYASQQQEYQRAKEVFNKYREAFEIIIKAAGQLGDRQEKYSLHFLGSDWKKQLEYINQSDY